MKIEFINSAADNHFSYEDHSKPVHYFLLPQNLATFLHNAFYHIVMNKTDIADKTGKGPHVETKKQIYWMHMHITFPKYIMLP